MGAGFDPGTGKPAAWAAPEPVTITWYQHAVGYAEMKWPHLAPHLRASLADALATVTPLLTQEPAAGRRQAGCAPPGTGTPSTPSSGVPRAGSGHRQRAGLAGTRVAAS